MNAYVSLLNTQLAGRSAYLKSASKNSSTTGRLQKSAAILTRSASDSSLSKKALRSSRKRSAENSNQGTPTPRYSAKNFFQEDKNRSPASSSKQKAKPLKP